jgi:hypothetical protein
MAMARTSDSSDRDRMLPNDDPGAWTPLVRGWLGWIFFAGVLLIMVGVLQVIEGLVALFDDGYYVVGADQLAAPVDYTVWGWVHLLVGVVAALIGVGLLTGNTVARGAAVGLASFSALASLAFVAAAPAWSVIIIAVDVLVIFAIVVHGGELEKSSRPG